AAPHYVVKPDNVLRAIKARRGRRDIFLIDLSVPRNIDPDIARIGGAYLYNVDDLKEVADRNLSLRLSRAVEADAIIEREVISFLRLLASHDAVPTIVELQGRIEEIRVAELEKCLRKVGPVTAEQKAAVEALSTAIVNKILHYPIVKLRESAADQEAGTAETMRQTIRRIFGLQ
ncbi:MAG TPA: glutamyl-tRNA reductase, partial [Thermoanaerobaculia bacterium]|nr:glutamyl-tRNA reductase [Thermoanaerobaculia bacterium]